MCTLKEYEEFLDVFEKADPSWCKYNSAGMPSLDLPSSIFKWNENYIYYASFAIIKCTEKPLDPLFFVQYSHSMKKTLLRILK